MTTQNLTNEKDPELIVPYLGKRLIHADGLGPDAIVKCDECDKLIQRRSVWQLAWRDPDGTARPTENPPLYVCCDCFDPC